MKILHLFHKTYDTGDGITNVVMNLTKNQNNIQSIESIFYAFSSDNKAKQKKEFNTTSILKLLFKIKKYSPDYVYIHGVFKIKIPLLIIILKIMRYKIILVPHCSLMRKTISYKEFKKKTYLFVFNLISFRYVNAIHFLNTAEMSDSVTISKNIFSYILPNGVNYSDDYPPKSFSKIKPFYIGRCDINHKGLDTLIRGLNKYFATTNNINNFNIYGASKKEAELIKKLKPHKNIIINSPVFNDEKKDIMIKNNIFIMTSRYEGLPISILEALSYGNICLLTEGTNMSEIVEKNNCGFMINSIDDIPNLLKKINLLPHDKLDVMSQNARELVKQNYDWKNITKKSIILLKNIT